MYTAVIRHLAIGGYALCFGSVISLPFWLGCTIFYVIKAFKEEPILLAHYPDYQESKKRTWDVRALRLLIPVRQEDEYNNCRNIWPPLARMSSVTPRRAGARIL